MVRFLALLLTIHLSAALAAAAERVNVVLILMDDLGRNDLGCYGSTYHRTPNLDRMAAEGLKWTDAYAACPVCSPTRAAIMTGKYPARLNLTDWLPGRADRPDQKLLRPTILQQLPLEETTLAEAFKGAGYATAHIGKWHLGGAGFEPQRQGYDVNIAGDHTGTPLSYFAPFRGRDGRFMPGLEKADDQEYLTDRLTREAEAFLERHHSRPFFLSLAHYAVHIPLRAKQDLIARYTPGTTPGRQGNPIYAAMIESMDESVGRILKKLDALKVSERTLVVFTSDNGGLCTLEGPNTPPTFNSPLREGKGYLYEGGVRVPLLMRLPGTIKAGSVANAPVSSIDLFPTMNDLCELKCSARVDGLSLAGLLRGGDAPTRDALYWHYPHYSNQGGRPGSAIRAGDLKYIEFAEGRRELYDLRKDVSESRNLIEEKADLARSLAAKLDTWRREVGARGMAPNPKYLPNPQAADGQITLPARTAEVHGIQLRYEPLPHKNTLGFWTRKDDWASWEFTVTKPGKFTVEILQGCGKGSGGSEVAFSVGEHTLTTTVEDTGHFQNFKSRAIGTLTIAKEGKQVLTVKPRSKPGVAVMDLRAVTLRRAE